MHDVGDLVRIGRVGLLRRLLDDLHRGVGIERVALRLETLGLELGDGVLGRRLLRGSGPNDISVPSTPGPPIEANSVSVMPSPEIMIVFMPWSRIWRTIKPPSVCRPPHIT